MGKITDGESCKWVKLPIGKVTQGQSYPRAKIPQGEVTQEQIYPRAKLPKSKVTQEQSYPKTKFPKGKVIQGQSYQGQSCLKSCHRQNLSNTIISKKLRRQKANLSEYKVDKEQIFLRKLK